MAKEYNTSQINYRNDLTAEYVRQILDYDPETGRLRWKYRIDTTPTWNKRFSGRSAGWLGKDGYLRVLINNKGYLQHRLAWLIMTGSWPEVIIDHQDLNRSNNKWENLRLANHAQNKSNSDANANNHSNLKGVSFHRATGKWRARIGHAGESKFLGLFPTKEDAHDAYRKESVKLYGDFARAG